MSSTVNQLQLLTIKIFQQVLNNFKENLQQNISFNYCMDKSVHNTSNVTYIVGIFGTYAIYTVEGYVSKNLIKQIQNTISILRVIAIICKYYTTLLASSLESISSFPYTKIPYKIIQEGITLYKCSSQLFTKLLHPRTNKKRKQIFNAHVHTSQFKLRIIEQTQIQIINLNFQS